jgi:hypothetical protein
MKFKIIAIVILIIPLILLLCVWGTIPEKSDMNDIFPYVPVDILLNKKMLILFLIVPFGIMLLPVLLKLLDPLKKKHQLFELGLSKIFTYVALFLTVFNVSAICCFMGINLPYNFIIPVLGLTFIIFMGNYLGKLRTNSTIGFITPWALKDEVVWQKTHRFAATFWVAAGIVGIVLYVIYPSLIVYGVVIASIIIAPFIHSYLIYHKRNK